MISKTYRIAALILIATALPLTAATPASEATPATVSDSGSKPSDAGATASTSAKPSETPGAELSRDALLIRAYRKEFIFLENEERALTQRLAEIDADRDAKVAELERLIKETETRIEDAKLAVGARETDLRQLEDEAARDEDAEQAVQSTLSQAMMTLEKYDVAPFPSKTGTPDASTSGVPSLDYARLSEEIDYTFTNALAVIQSLTDVRVKTGSFFLPNGSETRGDVIYIGNVAALGVSEQGGGTLAPAGNQMLSVIAPETEATARLLRDGRQPSSLPIYLYESLDKAVQKQEQKTVRQILKSGGIIGYVIVVLGSIGVLLTLARAVVLRWSATNTAKLLRRLEPLIRTGDRAQALAVCQSSRGSVASVLASTIRHIDADPAQLEDVISESILHETPQLDRFESAIRVFAAVAPLLGLLGTVTGMISTFDVLTVYGTGDPKHLSGGISEALVTTELGLIVAIPLLLLGSLLSGWSDRIKSGMENAALRVTNLSKGFYPDDAAVNVKPSRAVSHGENANVNADSKVIVSSQPL